MTNSAASRYRDLVDKLYRLTLERKIQWQMNPFINQPECDLGRFSVSIKNTQNEEGTPFVQISINNKDGECIDLFTDGDISEESPSITGFSHYWGLMSDLLRLTSRQASGADEALDEIFDILNDKDLPF